MSSKMKISSTDKSKETESLSSSNGTAATDKHRDSSSDGAHKLNMFLDDTLSKILINTISMRNLNVERTLCRELKRIVKQKGCCGMILKQQLVELEKEIRQKRLVGSEPRSQEKIEKIKVDIEQIQLKICSLEEYADKLIKTIDLFFDNRQIFGEIKVEKLVVDNADNSTLCAPSPSLSSSSSSLLDSKPERRRVRSKEWRKTSNSLDSNTWKVITPVLMEARRKLKTLQDNLNLELRKQINSNKNPSRSKLLRIKALEQEVANCEEQIKMEEDHALNVYKSVICSKDSRLKIKIHPARLPVFSDVGADDY